MVTKLRLDQLSPRLGKMVSAVPSKYFKVLYNEIIVWMGTTLEGNTQKVLSNRILKRRTGNLAATTHWHDKMSGKGLKLLLLSQAPYATILEEGGIIKPKNKQWLTIPIKGNKGPLTPSGVTKKTAQEYKDDPNEDTFVMKSKKGNLIIFKREKLKTKTNLIPLFILKKRVRIPPKRWAFKAINDSLPELKMKVLSDATILGKVVVEELKK